MERSFKQNLQDVTLTVTFNGKIKAKLFNIEIKSRHVTVRNKFTNEQLIDGDLYAPINESESTWWIDDAKELNINLEKVNQQEWWPHVFTTDEKIDTTKLQPEQSKLSDLDPETRASVEKMIFDQRQKQMGLPTSEKLQKQQTFEKFKKMHPELDFSQVKEPEF